MANNFPNILPSFNADFVNGIYVDPRITFTRAGTRTYFGQEMVKAEENLFLNSVWAGAVSGTPGTAPTSWTLLLNEGSLTVAGEAIQFDTATGTRQGITQTITVAAGQTIAVSVDVDAVSGDATDRIVGIEPLTATATSVGSITVADGTGRKTATATVTVAGTIRIRMGAAVNTVSVSGCSVTLKSPQFELRSSATAYTATTTQPITRYQRLLKTAAANEWPREFDPVTGECLGRSVWESRTNLLLRSEEFNTSWSISSAALVVNTAVAPDGTLSSEKIITNAAGSNGQVFQSISKAASAVTYTSTVFAKAGEWNTVGIYVSDSASFSNRADINVNLVTGLVTSAAAARGTFTAGSGTVTSVGNGWFRISLTFTSSTETQMLNRIYSLDSVAATGDGYSGIYIWGAQLEVGAFASPYTPTVAAQVTRLADSAVMTGVNFSSWYRQDEGTFVAEVQTGPTSALSGVQPYYVLAVRDTNSDAISVGFDSVSGFWNQVWVGNVAQASISATSVASSANKIAFKYKVNDFAVSSNGGAVGTDTVGTVPVVNAMQLGRNRVTATGSIYLKRITYYNQALTAANLQAITR